MTESGRRQHIHRALAELRERQARVQQETFRVPLRGGMVLEVIDLPLDVPILNDKSFRIAPQLEDHPQRDLVKTKPESAEAQAIITQLVKEAHRKADDLKDNLADEGQTQPGVITRDGKLINANTRCVLLRELAREGRAPTSTVRVAVLPGDVSNQELLELEMVLQQQVELKDEYRFVNKLMMIQRLHEEGFTDEAIARKLRETSASKFRTGAQKIKDLREVLRLMERARRLPREPLPITEFDTDVKKEQNWIELLREVRRIEEEENHRAADQHIMRWLIAYFSGADAVHQLRLAVGDWVERDGVIDDLQEHSELSAVLKTSEQDGDGTTGSEPAEPEDLGLDLLGDDEAEESAQSTQPVRAVLDVVVAARKAGEEPVALPNGKSMAGLEIKEQVRRSVDAALDRVKRRRDAGDRLKRPINELEAARTALISAIDALDEVCAEPGFTSQWPLARNHTHEIIKFANKVLTILNEHPRDNAPKQTRGSAA